MRVRGMRLLRELLAAIMGQFYQERDPDQVEALAAFLQPLVRETELCRARRARNRARNHEPDALPGEIDEPETPDTLEPPGEDTDPDPAESDGEGHGEGQSGPVPAYS